MSISPKRREEIVDALRRGTVPQNSLDAFAVGLEGFEAALDEELGKVSVGGGVFKAVRGEYGCGKTFFARWLADRARKLGFASAEVQVSETETPLHRLETVYRKTRCRESAEGRFNEDGRANYKSTRPCFGGNRVERSTRFFFNYKREMPIVRCWSVLRALHRRR